MPNPDFGSTAADAVRPKDQSITVSHRNAERSEEASLAAPNDTESKSRSASTATLLQAEEVDKTKKLT
jgi:hypothetical protein